MSHVSFAGRGFQGYAWKGEPIPDIMEWCRQRGEQMVVLLYTPRPHPNPLTGRMVTEEPYEQEMPESFYSCIRYPEDVGISEVRRYYP